MRPSKPVRALLLTVLGLALLVNAVWLFPAEGDTRYTYDRTEITVENGTFDYRHAETFETHEWNDLAPIDCDGFSGPRTCAFDEYLAAHGPVTVTDDGRYGSRLDFVRLDDRYYNRTATRTENGSVYDVERIAPRDLLGQVAVDLSGVTADDVSDRSLQTRVAVTGEPASTTDIPDRDAVGEIYRRGGTYYTVVVVEEGVVDASIFAEWMRTPLSVLGMFLLVVALIVGVGDREREF